MCETRMPMNQKDLTNQSSKHTSFAEATKLAGGTKPMGSIRRFEKASNLKARLPMNNEFLAPSPKK
jgi:hypothetical protein